MNPGFLSYITITLSVILVSFGWRSQAIGKGSMRAALLFCASWVLGAAIVWGDRGTTYAGTFVYVPLLVLSVVQLCGAFPRKEIVSGLSFALLLGAVFSLMELAEAVDPLIIVVHPLIDPILVLAVLVVCYTRSPAMQMALVSVSLMVNDAYMALLYVEWGHVFFGGRSFQDAWWLSIVTVRAGSETIRVLLKMAPGWILRLLVLLRLRR